MLTQIDYPDLEVLQTLDARTMPRKAKTQLGILLAGDRGRYRFVYNEQRPEHIIVVGQDEDGEAIATHANAHMCRCATCGAEYPDFVIEEAEMTYYCPDMHELFW